MKDYIDDILKGTAMEEVQIIKKTSTTTPVSTTPKTTTKKETPVAATPKKRRTKKATVRKLATNAETGNRRGKDYTTIRVSKEFTLALKILFDGQNLTHIMDQIVEDYLNRHRKELEEKYQQLKPF
ncbi:MAG: hypothetical protein AAF960_22515 [Bacteroidota bacterium]